MKHRYLLFLAATTLLAADFAAEGKLWWAHIEYLADDKLEGRNVGTEGFTKAVSYVASQFDQILRTICKLLAQCRCLNAIGTQSVV